MKRDCGKGELIPLNFLIKYHTGKADREQTKSATGPDDVAFDTIQKELTPYGDIRLYVRDKAGYCNCIRSVSCMPNGEFKQNIDRRKELIKVELTTLTTAIKR